jgi:hypothetical protein
MQDKEYDDLTDEALVNLLNDDEDVAIKGAQNIDFNA